MTADTVLGEEPKSLGSPERTASAQGFQSRVVHVWEDSIRRMRTSTDGMNDLAQVIEIRTGRVWRDDEGIIHVAFHPGVTVTLEDAEEEVRALATLCDGVRRPRLIDVGEMKGIERGAREMFAGPASAKLGSATALLVRSPLARALGNFFLQLSKPLLPTRLFSDEPSATEWLRTHL